MLQAKPSRNSNSQNLAWVLSFVLHAVLVGSFVSFSPPKTGQVSNSTIELVNAATPKSSIAQRLPTKKQSGKFLKSEVRPVSVNLAAPRPSAVPSEVASSAEATVLAAAGDQNAPQGVRDAYVMRLRGMIEKNKSYPIRARQLGLSGEVIVSFTILASGHVTDVKVEKPCHHNLLNQHAVEIVEHIENFEPIPQELGLSHWHMTVPIEFALN